MPQLGESAPGAARPHARDREDRDPPRRAVPRRHRAQRAAMSPRRSIARARARRQWSLATVVASPRRCRRGSSSRCGRRFAAISTRRCSRNRRPRSPKPGRKAPAARRSARARSTVSRSTRASTACQLRAFEDLLRGPPVSRRASCCTGTSTAGRRSARSSRLAPRSCQPAASLRSPARQPMYRAEDVQSAGRLLEFVGLRARTCAAVTADAAFARARFLALVATRLDRRSAGRARVADALAAPGGGPAPALGVAGRAEDPAAARVHARRRPPRSRLRSRPTSSPALRPRGRSSKSRAPTTASSPSTSCVRSITRRLRRQCTATAVRGRSTIASRRAGAICGLASRRAGAPLPAAWWAAAFAAG